MRVDADSVSARLAGLQTIPNQIAAERIAVTMVKYPSTIGGVHRRDFRGPAGHRTSTSFTMAGPTTTIMSTGRMQNTVGKIIFIETPAARVSAA